MNSISANSVNSDLPNFFLIGAPKCGTTSMAAYLSSHPDVFISHPKEPNYFNSDFSTKYRLYQDWDRYLSECFSGSESYKYRGECTVWYLYSDVAIKGILEKFPQSKFLVMLRNPIDLAQSLHAQMLYGNNEEIVDFKQAWDLQAERRQGKNMPPHCREAKMLQYGAIAKLGEQLQRALLSIPENNLKVIFFDDFRRDASESFQEVTKFLGLDPCNEIDFRPHNARKANRSNTLSRLLQQIGRLPISKVKTAIGIPRGKSLLPFLRRLNAKTPEKNPLDQAFKKELNQYFLEDITLLERLTQRSLSHWKID